MKIFSKVIEYKPAHKHHYSYLLRTNTLRKKTSGNNPTLEKEITCDKVSQGS